MDQQEHDLVRETQEIWDQNAAWWDNNIGEGNDFQRLLINPTTEGLLELTPDELVLDVACGNGNFSRRMAQLGASVVACDFSEVFLERARERTTLHADRIEYHLVDATKREQLLALGKGRFDAAVCNMALMDMVTIEPLLEAMSQLLKPGGRFVFSVSHPCFNSIQSTQLIERVEREGTLSTQYAVKVWGYITPVSGKGQGIIGQPAPHYYFERPLSMLLQRAFRAGFVLDGFEEPVFAPEEESRGPFSWQNFKEMPAIIVARLRLPKEK